MLPVLNKLYQASAFYGRLPLMNTSKFCLIRSHEIAFPNRLGVLNLHARSIISKTYTSEQHKERQITIEKYPMILLPTRRLFDHSQTGFKGNPGGEDTKTRTPYLFSMFGAGAVFAASESNEKRAERCRLGSVDTLEGNSPVNPPRFSELEADGNRYELVSEQNPTLKHFKIKHLRQLKAHLPNMNLPAELKSKIAGLNEKFYHTVTFSKEEIVVLRTQFNRLKLTKLNWKLDNPSLNHFEVKDLMQLKAYLPNMNLSVELKNKIIGLDKKSYQTVIFSREEMAALRAQLNQLGLTELNQKLGNPFRASVQNGQLVWRSVHRVDAGDVRALVDFETRHGRRVHINTGTHGDEQGNTVVDDKTNAQSLFSKEDLTTAWTKDNVSVHIVSSLAPPIHPKHIDRIDAWCFSVKSNYSDRASAQEVKGFIDSLLEVVGVRTANGSTHIAGGINQPNQTAYTNSGTIVQGGRDVYFNSPESQKK